MRPIQSNPGMRATRKGRLLLLGPSAYPLGGLATWLDYVIPGLETAGWDITVTLARGRWHDDAAYRRQHPTLSFGTVESVTGSREGRVRSLQALFEREHPELVLVVNVADAYEAARRMRCTGRQTPRVVMAIHALEQDYFDDVRAQRDLLDGVVGASRLACRLANTWGRVDENRVHYAPCGVPARQFSRSEGAGVLRLAYVGRLDESQKRVGDLCAIAERLAANAFPFRLEIVGDGPDEARMRERLAPLLASGHVGFRGRMPADEVARQVLGASDVLLHTSARETGPLVVWEAMAHQVAVVCSRYLGSGAEAALRDEVNCLLFEVGDIEGAIAKITALADAGFRERLVDAGLRLVDERYREDLSIDMWSRALDSVLVAPDLPAPERAAEPPASGRLDRWLGRRAGEHVRELMGRKFAHTSAGGEWPHSYSSVRDEAEFLTSARALDIAGAPDWQVSVH